MSLRTAAVFLTMTMFALGASTADAAKGPQRVKPGAAKKGARDGTRPERRQVDEAPDGASLSGTRARPPASRSAGARPVRQQVVSGERPVRQGRTAPAARAEQFASPYHAARAARRPGRLKRWLIAGGVALAIGVGFVAGNAYGVGNTVGNWFERTTQQQQSPWENMPDPPPGWPAPGERPDWVPDRPSGSTGNNGPPSAEQIKQQFEQMGFGDDKPADK